MMVIENKYEIGDTVYLLTDSEQLKRIVLAITVYKAGELMYKLINGTVVSEHYDFEMSSEKDFVTN